MNMVLTGSDLFNGYTNPIAGFDPMSLGNINVEP